MTIVRIALLACGLTAAALGLAAVEPTPPFFGEKPSGTAADPPPGQLLVATEQLQDPRFHHTVILILRHSPDGAFGIVVNHRFATEPIAKLLAATGDDDKSVAGTVRILLGGPVQKELGFLVHSAEYRRPETMAVDGKVAMTASREALRDIGHDRGPKKCFFAFGYAGWGPGQLEGEIARRDWVSVPEDGALVFDAPRDTVWDKAFARRGTDL